MANAAVLISREADNSPITLLLSRRNKGGSVEPPEGFAFLADENRKILRDERGQYLIEHKED